MTMAEQKPESIKPETPLSQEPLKLPTQDHPTKSSLSVTQPEPALPLPKLVSEKPQTPISNEPS